MLCNCDIKLSRSNLVSTWMVEMLSLADQFHTRVPRNSFSTFYLPSLLLLVTKWALKIESASRKTCRGGGTKDHPLAVTFPFLSISLPYIMLQSLTSTWMRAITHHGMSTSWGLRVTGKLKIFYHFLPYFYSKRFSMKPDRRLWTLCGSCTFTSRPFLVRVAQFFNSLQFPMSNFNWKGKQPHKIKAFIWTLALNKINTNDLPQKRSPQKALSPNACVLQFSSSETLSHLFGHCPVAWNIRKSLVTISDESWVIPNKLEDLLLNYMVSFGRKKRITASNYGNVLCLQLFGAYELRVN